MVGGVDSLCKMTVQGFASLEAMALEYCRPLTATRDGINIGEGAAIFLMSRDVGEVRLLGGAGSSDAHHISAPHPQGDGAFRAMRDALLDGRLQATDIDYLNLHGTGTPQNDSMECIAVNRLFGDGTPCSSTCKSMTGHTLGAAAALELLLLLVIIEQW
ncbi:MAG: hypothetical protein IPG64_11520 [Haliea sp.]|nr:hypothetical protein [Haliea sp.]